MFTLIGKPIITHAAVNSNELDVKVVCSYTENEKEFRVRININNLNIRNGSGTHHLEKILMRNRLDHPSSLGFAKRFWGLTLGAGFKNEGLVWGLVLGSEIGG